MPPTLQARAVGDWPLRLVAQPVAKDDPDRQALACYDMRLPKLDEGWRRFLEGRPASAVTTIFRAWCCREAAAHGKTAPLSIGDNASWHSSEEVREWIRDRNRQIQASGQGVRLIVYPLPIKRPWLHPIEPKWVCPSARSSSPTGCCRRRTWPSRSATPWTAPIGHGRPTSGSLVAKYSHATFAGMRWPAQPGSAVDVAITGPNAAKVA